MAIKALVAMVAKKEQKTVSNTKYPHNRNIRAAPYFAWSNNANSISA